MERTLRRASVALVATVWLSAALFGAYILAYYAGAVVDQDLASWNGVLPRIYEPSTPAATVAIGLHFAAGGIILVLGFIQLIGPLRDRHPRVHRVLGRVYVTACLLAGLGGLAYILLKGTVGGTVMDLGFGAYGVLMVLCSIQTFRYARARVIARHRVWALRLFALAVGSWLYRMDYGFWFILADGIGHTDDFRGPFDAIMSFAFFVPNLVLVELYVRAHRRPTSSLGLALAAGLMLATTAFLLVGTYFFTTELWAPAIADRLG